VIPIPWRLIVIGGALAAAVAFGWSIKARLDAGAHAQEQVERLTEDLRHERRAQAVANAALSGLANDQRKVRTITKEVVREILVRVPVDAPPVPGYWRVLHDAAVRGEPPAATGGTDAAPVAAQDAATTVVENYGTCADTANQLARLQEWVRGVTHDQSNHR
jgi:hypothetical protein